MTKLGMSIVVVALAVGCTTDESLQKITAPLTKCNVANLQITDIVIEKPTTWRAICRSDGRIYHCTKTQCTEVQ